MSSKTPPRTVNGVELLSEKTHDWLLPLHEPTYHPGHLQIAVRNYVQTLPDTKATFAKCEPVKNRDDLNYRAIKDEMLYHVGSWKVQDSTNRQRWVNPTHPDRITHAPVKTTCECGTRLLNGMRDKEKHADDCTKQQRYAARAVYFEKRAEVGRRMAKFGVSVNSQHERLGLEDKPYGSIWDGLGVDISSLKDDYRERRLNTILALLEDLKTADVARVYGITPNRLRTLVSKQTDYSLRDFSQGGR
jgi:hypothetical protein